MDDNRCHRVDDRIVSLSRPYLRPIVRGKAKAAVEFGAKRDISVCDGCVWKNCPLTHTTNQRIFLTCIVKFVVVRCSASDNRQKLS